MFELPKISYSYNALEPHIDAQTMEIHHTKHHQAYTDNLNKALEGVDTNNASIEEILGEIDMNNMPLRNNAGGYYNHKLFWELLSPEKTNISSSLEEAIQKSFGSFESFKEIFTKAALSRFGSGWAWLCKKEDGSLEVVSTGNQDNPLMPGIEGGMPILALDVWEHAYYLKYQNKRAEYIENFWNIINWNKVTELYEG
jgi:Fe-Mn family superoxide dismutase